MNEKDNVIKAEWHMGDRFFEGVSFLLFTLIESKEIFERDPSVDQVNDYISALHSFMLTVGSCFNEKSYDEMNDKWKELKSHLKVDKQARFYLDLGESASKRVEIQNKLHDFTQWIIRTAYKNDLIIKKSTYNKNHVMSDA